MNEYYHWYKLHGICTGCFKEKAAHGKTKCLVCLSIDAEKKQRIRDAYTSGQRKGASVKRCERAKAVQNERRAQGLCPYCGRKVEANQKQCDFCRARKRANAERYRRSHGVISKQMMREDETICSICGKPVKTGFKVCESCYRHCVDMGQKGRANRKVHFWEKDNRIVFLGSKGR